MTDSISFLVRGLPIPQGSTRAWVVNGKPIITSSAKGLGAWRRLVADVAQEHAPEGGPWVGPVVVDLRFTLPRPKSAPKTRTWPDKRPDLDKLVRAVLDAITYILIADDAQVVELTAWKGYGTPGVYVEIRRAIEAPS